MLSDTDHATIALATARYRYPAARETDAFDQLGMSPAVFWRHVFALADDPDAIAAYPAQTRHLRALRDARRRLRSA